MRVVIDLDENIFTRLFDNGTEDYEIAKDDLCDIAKAIRKGTPLTPSVLVHILRGEITPSVLAHMLMDKRIKRELDHNTTFEQDITRDVKCILTVSIIDRRPC